jgi:hypothetical protein
VGAWRAGADPCLKNEVVDLSVRRLAVAAQTHAEPATDAAGWGQQACGDVSCGLSAAAGCVDDAVQGENLTAAVYGVDRLESGDRLPLGGHGCPRFDEVRGYDERMLLDVLQALGADVYDTFNTRSITLTGRPLSELTPAELRECLSVIDHELHDAQRELESSDPMWAAHLASL